MKLSNDSLIRMDQRHMIWSGIWMLAAMVITYFAALSTVGQWHWLAQSLLWAFGPAQIGFGALNLYLAARDYRRDTEEFGR